MRSSLPILAFWAIFRSSEGAAGGQVHCRERARLIETELGDLYALIDATLGQKLTLQCHYCGESDDLMPKNWFKIDAIGAGAPHEVQLDMDNNHTKNKIHVNSDHSLIINSFDSNDTGLYYCKRFEDDKLEEKHNYFVDLAYPANVTDETGNLTDWKRYYDEYFAPIDDLFAKSNGVEFKRVRETWRIEMEMVTQWRNWGSCEVCGRAQNDGIRRRLGLCRVKTRPNGTGQEKSPDERFLFNATAVACRSLALGRLLPGISNLTRVVPNFVQTQRCEGTCNPDAEGLDKGWKAGKKSKFKYRKTYVLEQNSHLTIVCPESALENSVVWKRNGFVLDPGESVMPPNPDEEPRILVDTFNTLYLVDVRESEEGNYTCQVDDIKMQQIIVFVVSKYKLLTHAFIRHFVYLGLALSLTLPCYFAGIIIACARKRYFKGYEQLKEETNRSETSSDDNFA